MSSRAEKEPGNYILRLESCLENKQDSLLTYYKDRNIRCFVDLLNENDVDINQRYLEEQSRTILQIAVDEGQTQYVEEIIRKKDVDPNLSNVVSHQTPLHSAVSKGYDQIVKLLIDSGADVNSKLENGNTPLHVAALRCEANWSSSELQKKALQKKFLNIIKILLASNAVPDAENNIGITPLYFAAESGTQEVVKLFLQKGCCVTVEVDGATPEDFIQQRMPNIVKEIHEIHNKRDNNLPEAVLFKTLYSEISNPGTFIKTAENMGKKIDWNSNDGGNTFLQYASDHGYDKIVEYLLEKGCNPNLCCPNNRYPPLLLAAHHGYFRVIKVFKRKLIEKGTEIDFAATDHHVKKENILHKMLKAESKSTINKNHRNYPECLKLVLMEETPSFKNNIAAAINGQDNLGNTPLHLAAQMGKHSEVRMLLACEANIGLKNLKGETPIAHISPAVLEDFLDSCVEGNGQITDDDFQIIYRYSFLGPPVEQTSLLQKESLLNDAVTTKNLPETEPLWYMSQIKDHRYLLCHPIITSFLWMKWRRIRPYFYMNMLFYTLFLTVLTAYILLSTTALANSGEAKEAILPNESTSNTMLPNEEDDVTIPVLKWLTFCLLMMLLTREICQIGISFRRYVFSIENLGEMALIVLTLYVLFNPGSDPTLQHISGVITLISWTEYVLLIGKHPRLSTYITMFKRVSWNFMSFLTWYMFFIISFGLCFYLIFHTPASEKTGETEEVNAYFSNPGKALMKTVVMSLTGEIEFESIEFRLPFGNIIFLLWIFFIVLVLVNLLNGLAVSDISNIQKEAEIVSCISRVELISYIESILLGDPFQFLTNFPESKLAQKLPFCNLFNSVYQLTFVKRLFSFFGGQSFLLFTKKLKNKKAVFQPNISKKEKSGQFDNLILSSEILEQSKALLVKKFTVSESAQIKSRLQSIEKTLLVLINQQNLIISKIKN